MRCPIYISLFFTRVMNFVSPYFTRANRFIKSISGILFFPMKQNPHEFMREPSSLPTKSSHNTIITVGYMEHEAKQQATMKHIATR